MEKLAQLRNELDAAYGLFETPGLSQQDCQALVRRVDSLNHEIAEEINRQSYQYSQAVIQAWTKAA